MLPRRIPGAFALALACCAPPVSAASIGDLDGDGRDDILLRGADARWLYNAMDGRRRIGASSGPANLPGDWSWRYQGIGDFDGDGDDDVLLRDYGTGRWHYYPMDGRDVPDGVRLAMYAHRDWRLAAVGDFDGDGTDDVLLRHVRNGRWYYYPVVRGAVAPGRGFATMTSSRNWQLAGVGDLNGDGSDDVLLRHTGGRWWYYPMAGKRHIAAQRGFVDIETDAAWRLADLADLDGDGGDEILLRHDDGRWLHYAMAGRTPADRGMVNVTRSSNFAFAGTGDLDGDGREDVLLRRRAGHWYYYPMAGRRFVPAGRGTTNVPAQRHWAMADFHVPREGDAMPVPAGALIRKRANHFDLEGTTVRFTPADRGGYEVAVGDLAWHEPGDADPVHKLRGSSAHVTVDLPFSFPFAGRTWTRLYANANGNVSFQRPEAMNWPRRDPWADAGMRSVAAAVDARAAAGLEAMIAVLWALYDDAIVTVESTPSMAVVTWRASRRTAANIYYEPLGENRFQARLHASGLVELAYPAVPERDGIVGLFHGGNGSRRTLDSIEDEGADVSNGFLDITAAELIDNGSTMLVAISLAAEVPDRIARSSIDYAVHLRFGDTACSAGLRVGPDGARPFASWCGPQPAAVGSRARGRTVEITISKILLNAAERFSWHAGAVWWNEEFDDTHARTVADYGADYDLEALPAAVHGNVFEVFHYPALPKYRIDTVLSHVYGRLQAGDEIAVAFTDFRIDDLFNSGGGTGPVNRAVQGIGAWQASPTPGHRYGSDCLLTSMMPAFLGAPNFRETDDGVGRTFRSYAPAIRWIAHEAVHRWAAHLGFRNPRTGLIEDLLDDYCRCHWSDYLHAPAMHPVWPGFSDESYVEASLMNGDVWVDNSDGTFTGTGNSYPLASGLSALDLYAMGMVPPTEVSETFILRDVRKTETPRTVRATKVPVSIADIVAAMGPRLPAAQEARREFRLGVYLLHEDGRPPRRELLERAGDLSVTVAEYFARATGGRMRVVPSTASVTPALRAAGPRVQPGSVGHAGGAMFVDQRSSLEP